MLPNVLRPFLKASPLLLIIGLLILMKKKPSQKPTKPIRANNPFSLIQVKPSKWLGLKTGSSGFLEFENMAFGVRAGFINLLNYLEVRRLRTIEKILPVYAPAESGNNPEAYISAVSKMAEIGRSDKIDSPEKLKAVGRAIIKVETGSDIYDQDFEEGYKLAESRIKKYFTA